MIGSYQGLEIGSANLNCPRSDDPNQEEKTFRTEYNRKPWFNFRLFHINTVFTI